MATLKRDMTHAEAATHLREEVVGTLRFETARLLGRPPSPTEISSAVVRAILRILPQRKPAFFGVVRGVLSDVDYVGALYGGWDGKDRRRIATVEKAVRFITDVFPVATGNHDYGARGEHLYDMFRHGTIHLRAPKRLTNAAAGTPILSWALMEQRTVVSQFENPTWGAMENLHYDPRLGVGGHSGLGYYANQPYFGGAGGVHDVRLLEQLQRLESLIREVCLRLEEVASPVQRIPKDNRRLS